ncbi:MAG: histidine triad nucleotide-binding protein [Corynebacteriales bacterium]|nr:histidine triad nucleotide-binding protein [Mycobacteriales bacterium]
MAVDCLFCRIVAREIPADVVYETDQVLAFRDIAPKAPVHVLVIPKEHHPTFAALGQEDPALAGALAAACGQVALDEGVADAGYRVLFNSGPNAGQEVFHVHAHVLGGKPLGPMLAR